MTGEWVCSNQAVGLVAQLYETDWGPDTRQAHVAILRRAAAGALPVVARLYINQDEPTGPTVRKERSLVPAAFWRRISAELDQIETDWVAGDFSCTGDEMFGPYWERVFGAHFFLSDLPGHEAGGAFGQEALTTTFLPSPRTTPALSKGGRPPKYDWIAAFAHLTAVANTPDGLFGEADAAPAPLMRLLADYFVETTGEQPAESLLRDKAHIVLTAINENAMRTGNRRLPTFIGGRDAA